MSNVNVKDGAAASKYLKATGAGTDGDPYIPQHLETNSAAILAAAQAVETAVEGTLTVQGSVTVSSAPTTAITAAALPLPSGAASSANQTTLIGHVDGIETLLGTIDGDTSTLAGAVAGTEVQVDVVGALPEGTATIGATKDAGPAWTSAYLHTASADLTGAADVTAAPTSGQKIVIDDIVVSVDTAMWVLFEEETSGTDVLKFYLPANGTLQVTPRGRIKLATADKKLRVDTSVAGNIAITVCYHSEA